MGEVSEPPVTILVVEDNPITRKLVQVTLSAEGYTVLEAPDGGTARDLLHAGTPDLVLLDLVLPDTSGFQLLREIRALPDGADIPVLAFTGFLPRDEEARGAASGFTEFLVKPVEPSRLVRTIRAYVGTLPAHAEPRGAGKRVLVVDDDPVQRKLARAHLERAGFGVDTAADGLEALEAARRNPPDAILSDVLMPRLDGFKLCHAVRQDPRLRAIPVVLQSHQYADEADRSLALRVGADMYLAHTPDLRDATEALFTALAAPAHRKTPGTIDDTYSEYLDRVVRQLERQASSNAELAQQNATQAAALAVLGSTADALARHDTLADILRDSLYRCIDAAGLSVGVCYQSRPEGGFRASTVVGFPDGPGAPVQVCFDHPEILTRALSAGSPVLLPTAQPEESDSDFLKRLGHKVALLVPIRYREERLGVLLMASNARNVAAGEWGAFAQVLSAQIGLAIALNRMFDDLRASEESYRTSEFRLQTIIDSALDAVVMMNAAGVITDWNRQAESMFGWTAAEAVGRVLSETIMLPRDREAHQRGLAHFLATGEGPILGRRVEVTALHRDGREFPVELTATPARLGDSWVFSAFVRDLTERKHAEAALRESEERHRLLINYTFDGFAITEDGIVREANRGFAQIFGYSVEELVGMPVEAFVASESRSAVRRRIQANEEGAFEAIGLRKDGRKIDLETVAKMYMHGGRGLRLTAVRDVTERRQLEDQFRQAQKMEAVGRLAGGVAHDFNNLLTVITSYSQLLLDDFDAEDARRADLEEIQKAAAGAATLTRQLLAFSRQQVLEPKVLDLNTVVAGAGKMLKRLIGEDVDLVTDLAPDLGAVKVDPGQVEQVVMNLAVNARDAMPEGGKITIATANAELESTHTQEHSVVSAGAYVLLSVSDTGIGMDDRTQARIFEPFFTTKEKGKGTGLGLATVYGIVKQSGGFIWVYSEPGHGTTFKIYLPRVTETPLDQPFGGSPEALHGTETVLLAEDSAGVRAVARKALMRNGYSVIEASDGQSALELAATHSGPIHLLVTDVIMPEMSGRQLADRLRDERPDLLVLFVSGYTDDAIIRHGILEPGIAFLQKPFTPEALARKVRAVLDERVPARGRGPSN